MKEEKGQSPKMSQTDNLRTPKQIIEEAAVEIPKRLLKYLRGISGNTELQYAVPPKRIMGGASGALLFGFEISSPPKTLAGPLVLRLRVLDGGDPVGLRMAVLHELAMQDAAGRLGCKVPKVRLKELSDEYLGGPFYIMDRIAGRSIVRWRRSFFLIGIVASLILWNGWPLFAGFLMASLVMGVAQGRHHRRLHSFNIEDVSRIYQNHGLQNADVDLQDVDIEEVDKLLKHTPKWMGEAIHEEFLPGKKWLQEHRPTTKRPILCHGDFHPKNILGTWTRVTGIIDWENAFVADPEYDVATQACQPLWGGRWIGKLLIPTYWIYRISYGLKLDHGRLRYYQARRAFILTAFLTPGLVDQATGKGIKINPISVAIFGLLIKNHARYFRKITGVEIPSPKKLAMKRFSK